MQRLPARARWVRLVLDIGYGTLPRLLALPGSSTGEGLDAITSSNVAAQDPSGSHERL